MEATKIREISAARRDKIIKSDADRLHRELIYQIRDHADGGLTSLKVVLTIGSRWSMPTFPDSIGIALDRLQAAGYKLDFVNNSNFQIFWGAPEGK